MKVTLMDIWPEEVKPEKQRFKEGASLDDGLSGAMKMRSEWDRPYTTKVHSCTEDRDADAE